MNGIIEKDKRAFQLFEIGRMRLIDYWKTDHWRNTRKEAVLKCGGRCQLCNSHKLPLNVHHRTYNNLWQEKDYDLIVLCRDCHALHHCKVDDVEMSFTISHLGLDKDYDQYKQQMARRIAEGLDMMLRACMRKKLLYGFVTDCMCADIGKEKSILPKNLDEFDFVQKNDIFPGITTKGFIISSLGFLKVWLNDEYEYKRLIKIFRILDKAGEFELNKY